MGSYTIEHTQKFLDERQASILFDRLKTELPWETDTSYFHRSYFRYDIPQVDLDQLKVYFGNIEIVDELWLSEYESLNQVMELFMESTGRKLNGLFCNYYKDENDYAGFHQDSYDSDVLTLSLGGERSCLFKPIEGGKV